MRTAWAILGARVHFVLFLKADCSGLFLRLPDISQLEQ